MFTQRLFVVTVSVSRDTVRSESLKTGTLQLNIDFIGIDERHDQPAADKTVLRCSRLQIYTIVSIGSQLAVPWISSKLDGPFHVHGLLHTCVLGCPGHCPFVSDPFHPVSSSFIKKTILHTHFSLTLPPYVYKKQM